MEGGEEELPCEAVEAQCYVDTDIGIYLLGSTEVLMNVDEYSLSGCFDQRCLSTSLRVST